MLLWVQYGITMAALLAVPFLFVWGNTGRLSQAWKANCEYFLVLLILLGPATLFSVLYWLTLSP